MKRFFRLLHLWLALPFGLIVAVICFSGAMLVFKQELTSLMQSSVTKVEPRPDGILPISALLDSVKSQLPDSLNIIGLEISSDPDEAWELSFSNAREHFYVDPYSGAVTGRGGRVQFFMFMTKQHRYLLLDDLGRRITGVSTLMFVLVLISGVVVWWPRNRQAFVSSLKFRANGLRPLLHSLHVAGGMYVVVCLLAMALTGLTWSFEWYRNGVYSLCGVDESQMQFASGHDENFHQAKAQQLEAQGSNPSHVSSGDAPSQESHGGHGHSHAGRGGRGRHGGFVIPQAWDAFYQTLSDKYSPDDFRSISLSPDMATVLLSGFGDQRATDTYSFNHRTGDVSSVDLYADTDKVMKVRGWIYTIHTGAWGGLVTRILAFLCALFGASLPLTGYYLWFKRISKSK